MKIMFFGLTLTILGGVFALNSEFKLGRAEYLITFIGLITSAIGFCRKN